MTEVIATDARRRSRFETPVAPADARNQRFPCACLRDMAECHRTFPFPFSPMPPDENPKSPEKSIRLGNVSASVFLNQTESGRDFRSVVFQRSYRTEAGERRFANSFSAADLPVLERVLKLAQEYVEQLEAVIDDAAEK